MAAYSIHNCCCHFLIYNRLFLPNQQGSSQELDIENLGGVFFLEIKVGQLSNHLIIVLSLE